ncbi:glycosyltransferase [soil metagenome]
MVNGPCFYRGFLFYITLNSLSLISYYLQQSIRNVPLNNIMSNQVFQSNNKFRWQSLKWTGRVLAFVILFFLLVLIFAIIRGSKPIVPDLDPEATSLQNTTDVSTSLFLKETHKKFKGFKEFLEKKEKEEAKDSIRNQVRGFFKDTLKPIDIPYIRAAFYTPWTKNTSLPSLKTYGNKCNTIFPEWFFIDTINTRGLQTRIDSAGLAEMQNKGLMIIPMLTNFNSSKKQFDGKLIYSLLHDNNKRASFINQLVDTLSYYKFQGINVDFENLNEPSNTALTNFQKQLYETLKAKNLLVTMDVDVQNDDYDYEQLAKYNDYLVLMAYNQFNPATGPGPVSSSKWIEDALDWTAKKIPPEKLILGVAAYGFDWTTDDEGNPVVNVVSYPDAVNTAAIVNARLYYDNDSYNLHYNYTVKRGKGAKAAFIKHEVWFTDAATTFNILRFSDEYATAGTALWRLGGEDPRMWSYYDKDLSNDAVFQKGYDFSAFYQVPLTLNSVGYIDSSGEVLDIVSRPTKGKISLEIDTAEMLIAEQNYEQLPSGYLINKLGEDTTVGKGHKIILTFDDGPDPKYTPMILDILQRENIPATFFIVGINAEKNIPLFQRIINRGYEIGNHTFTHNNIAKMSVKRSDLEMKLTRLLIESISGRSTILFRAPYNADSQPQTYEELEPIARSRNQNYITVAESIDPMDWQPGVTADSIVARTINQIEERNASIILLHDAGGETRQATVDALPRIIAYCKSKGYVFTTVADLIGRTRDQVMPKVPGGRQQWVKNFNFYLAEFMYWGGHFVYILFIAAIILSLVRMVCMGVLASIKRIQEKKQGALISKTPKVSIIVPAYNEEVNSVKTVYSLLQQDYNDFEIVFVDDGSKDNTYEIVLNEFANDQRVQVYTKTNGGKATALNVGISKASGDYVVCIDADTQLKSDAVSELMKKFTSEDVGAVAGNVKVGNEINLITRWQSIEYITSQNYDRRAFDLINCITVIPGALGAFKKSAVIEAGGFTMDTLAEDCDLTMRLHRFGYSIKNCTAAISYTEAPETISQFLKQRFRWSFGVMQSFWKHRDTLFNKKYKKFGMVAMPNILIYQLMLPLLAPLADILLIVSIMAASAGFIVARTSDILFYYFIFTLVDSAGAAMAFSFEKVHYSKLLWIIPQRLIYRQLMYYILFKSFNRAIKGEGQGWGTLKRTGRVKHISLQN